MDGCTHGCQGLNIGWSSNGGSMMVSFPWKRVHPWVPHMIKNGVQRSMGPLLGPSHGRGCTHGCQELKIGWSTNGSMLMSIPWMGAPMGASQGQKWGVEINGSIVGSVPWKRAHPWVPRAEHWLEHQWVHCWVRPMEEGAPMGAKSRAWAGAPMAPC